MTEKYELSIIIPHYNSPVLLEKLLSTIPLNKEIQTIVIDDHSDKTVKEYLHKIKSLYSDRNIIFLENNSDEHNPGATRNIGLKNAEGKWLLFADADDYFLDGFYEIVKKYLKTDYDIIFFSPTSCQLETGKKDVRHVTLSNNVKKYLEKPCVTSEVYLRYLWVVPWSKLIRNYLVKENNITFESIKICEDIMFSVLMGYYAKKITACEEEIYCVTHGSGSITAKQDLNTFDIRVQTTIRMIQFLKSHLTKREFRAAQVYRQTDRCLFLIFQRKYGFNVFIKYFNIFRKSKVPIFDIRIFSLENFRRLVRLRFVEKNKSNKNVLIN